MKKLFSIFGTFIAFIIALFIVHAPTTQTIDPVLNLNNASFTFDLILTRPSNTLELVSATDTQTITWLAQHPRFVLNIPAQNGGASSTLNGLTPGGSVFSPWKANIPGTFPSGTYNYLMFLGTECYGNCTTTSTVATGTFTIN